MDCNHEESSHTMKVNEAGEDILFWYCPQCGSEREVTL